MITFKKFARHLVLSLPVLGLFLYSCDKVNTPYATVKKQTIDTTNTRKILLEDYTGHTCPNCPEGTQIGQALQNLYGGKVIMIAVHAGFFARPLADPFTADYRTIAGDAWNNEFQFSSYPNGLVNRKYVDSALILSPDKWAGAIDSLVILPADAGITIACSVDTLSRVVTADITSKFINDIEGTFNITLCVVEDGIVSAQKNSIPAVGPTPIIYNYEYKDMLRATITDPWGDFLKFGPEPGEKYLSHFVFSLDPGIVIKNASLVAFISNANTKEILQAEKKKIIK